jgi:hypothetical protein
MSDPIRTATTGYWDEMLRTFPRWKDRGPIPKEVWQKRSPLPSLIAVIVGVAFIAYLEFIVIRILLWATSAPPERPT